MIVEQLTDVDTLLLERWADTVGIRDAIKELEDRLGDRLEAVAERVRPWLESRGYMLLSVDRKSAGLDIGKDAWMKNREESFIWLTVDALFPFGYRKVSEEHPYVWLSSSGLAEDEQTLFLAEVSQRLRDRPGGWLNEDCHLEAPAGRYIESHRDSERARLAQSEDALESFIKTELDPLLALGAEFDSALQAVRGNRRVKARA